MRTTAGPPLRGVSFMAEFEADLAYLRALSDTILEIVAKLRPERGKE
jgi:hypothetical protein